MTGLIVALAAGAVMGLVVDADHAAPDKLRIKLGGVRCVEANAARIDAVLRTITNTHGPGLRDTPRQF